MRDCNKVNIKSIKPVIKNLFIILFVVASTFVKAQDKYFTRTGNISFISKTPIIDIAGYNKEVLSYINLKTGKIVFGVVMKSFKFPLPLAEEHFNENYVESDKYPDAKFNGIITNINDIDLTKYGDYKANVEGSLTIHGITKKIKVTGNIKVTKDKIFASAVFKIAPEDYNIIIPNLVVDKIAKEVDTYVDMIYEPYVKGK